MRFGIAEINIRTPIGMQMTGYAGRVTGAIGIHDQLKMSAVYIESNGVKSIIITCQLLGFDPDFSRITELKIAQALNLPVANIIIASIHTHAGPASGTLYGCGTADPLWLEQTQHDLVKLAKDAVSETFEGYFEYLTGECEIAMNRVAMANKYPNYMDMIDKEVGIIKIYNKSTYTLKAIYLNYGCHPVTLDNKNYLYSADYAYYAIKKLKENYGQDVVVIFSTGCCGDINPRYRLSFENTEKSGNMLADSVLTAKTELIHEDAGIKCYEREQTIPLAVEHSYEGYKKIKEDSLIECHKSLENIMQNYVSLQIAAVKVLWADLCMKGFETDMLITEIHPVIKIMRIGDINIVALPFEVFHDLGLRIKNMLGIKRTLVIGYSNGVYGYLPYGELYDKAGYETKTAHRYYGYPGPVCKDAGDIICKCIEDMI